jgi:hypothetical protein
MIRKFTKSLMVVLGVLLCCPDLSATDYKLNPAQTTVIWASGSSSNTTYGDSVFYNADATEWRCTQANISGGKLNNQNAANGGSYAVITKFDGTSQLSGLTILKATLKFKSVCTVSGKNSNVIIASVGANWSADTLTWNKMDRTATKLSAGDGTNVKTSTVTLTQDVTELLKANLVQAFAIYTFTAREQKITEISMEVEAIDPSSSVNVTLKYVDGEANVLKTAATIGTTGEKLALTSEQKADFFVGDSIKWIYVSDNSADVTLSKEDSVVTLVYRKAAKCVGKLNAVNANDSVLQLLDSVTAFEGEKVNIGYPSYINVGGQLWGAGKNYSNDGKGFQTSMTFSADGFAKNLKYTDKGIGDVVYLSEGENIEGMTVCNTSNAAIRSSNSKAAYAPADVTFTKLPAGKYKVYVVCYDAQKNPNSTWTIKADSVGVASVNCTTINYWEAPAVSFNLYEESNMVIAKGGNGSVGLDLIYIVKTGEVYSTTTFDFADPQFREHVGTALADVQGNIYNETFAADSATLQVTAGSAASKLYVDKNRGQNLVTYKEYTTLTFRAPAGKAIAKIEFTAAGNSNINNFAASSGTIEGMTWKGNATGVRFAQGGTSYLAKAVLTLMDKTTSTDSLPAIVYAECENIAAFNALEAGSYAKVTLTDAEVIGKSADGYSTVWMQDATGGCWIQYTSLNDSLTEGTKVNGSVYVVKRAASGNPQMKEAEGTIKSELNATAISDYTVVAGDSIKQINVAANLNKVVKIVADSLKMTSATEGTLYVGQESIAMNNGGETANQQLHKIADWKKDSMLVNVEVTAILVAKSATANQLLPVAIEQLAAPADALFDFQNNNGNWPYGEGAEFEKGNFTTLEMGNVVLTNIQGSSLNPSRIMKNASKGIYVQSFKNTALKLTAPEGKAIVSVAVTMQTGSFDFTPNFGAVAENVWTGNAAEVTFENTKGTRYIWAIAVYLADANADTQYPAVATEVSTIAEFLALEDGTNAKLTLTNAQVNGYYDLRGAYYVEDATGAVAIKGAELKKGTLLNGTIEGVKSTDTSVDMESAVVEIVLTASDASALQADSTQLKGTVMTVAEVGAQANYGRLITVENVTISGTGNNKTLTDSNENTIKARDLMGVLSADFVWPEKAASLTGILFYNVTSWFLMPISDEAIVAAQTTGIRNINAADRNVVIYNLQGVRQDRAKKGLNIIDGKKVVLK